MPNPIAARPRRSMSHQFRWKREPRFSRLFITHSSALILKVDFSLSGQRRPPARAARVLGGPSLRRPTAFPNAVALPANGRDERSKGPRRRIAALDAARDRTPP